jgi:membrane-associated phospholipid phosphatase
VSGVAIAFALAVAAIGRGGNEALRAWVPHAYLVAGYWLPALLVSSPSTPAFQHWLTSTDARLRTRLPAVPGPLTKLVEIAYLLCYPIIPVALAIVWWKGDVHDLERFWFSVLVAGFACYGSIPWLVSQPPRLHADQVRSRQGIAALNASVLHRFSHRLNTFPSGHVAVAGAAAVSVAFVSPVAGLVLAIVAVAIGVGAAAGGYHYVVDVLFGGAVAVAACVLAALL